MKMMLGVAVAAMSLTSVPALAVPMVPVTIENSVTTTSLAVKQPNLRGPIHCTPNGCWEEIRPWFAQPAMKATVTYSVKFNTIIR